MANYPLQTSRNLKICLTLLVVTLFASGLNLAAQVPFYIPGETDAHWTSNIPGYYIADSNRMMVWNTNTEQFWRGHLNQRTWVEDTNGWRVQITFYTNTPLAALDISVGSVTVNSGRRYFSTPDYKFEKFELSDTNGILIRPKLGASMESSYPPRLSTRAYPEWGSRTNTGLGYSVSIFSNGPPQIIYGFALHNAFSIKAEGDYLLTVCPVLYKLEMNQTNLDRVNLPCVTAKVHLVPDAK